MDWIAVGSSWKILLDSHPAWRDESDRIDDERAASCVAYSIQSCDEANR